MNRIVNISNVLSMSSVVLMEDAFLSRGPVIQTKIVLMAATKEKKLHVICFLKATHAIQLISSKIK